MLALISRIPAVFGSASVALADPMGDATNFVFFSLIDKYLSNKIAQFQWELLGRTASWVGGISLVLLTFWVIVHGYRIVTGQSREPMMALVGNSLKAALIIGVATAAATTSPSLYWTLTDGISSEISQVVAGTSSPLQSIDNNLAAMQGAMTLIDSLDTAGDPSMESTKTQDKWFTGIGVAGPGVIAGSMLLLNKIALALFIGFGPLFILALLFPQTKSLFSKWLFYGIGTVFSLAVLSVMVTMATEMIRIVTLAFVAKYAAAAALTQAGISDVSASEGINSMAMQQGGLGLILSALIISAPPMAAAFFQGVLGQFQSYSSFGSVGAHDFGGGGGQQQRAIGNPAAASPPPTQSRDEGTKGRGAFTNYAASGSAISSEITQDQIRQQPSPPAGLRYP